MRRKLHGTIAFLLVVFLIVLFSQTLEHGVRLQSNRREMNGLSFCQSSKPISACNAKTICAFLPHDRIYASYYPTGDIAFSAAISQDGVLIVKAKSKMGQNAIAEVSSPIQLIKNAGEPRVCRIDRLIDPSIRYVINNETYITLIEFAIDETLKDYEEIMFFMRISEDTESVPIVVPIHKVDQLTSKGNSASHSNMPRCNPDGR